MFGFGRQSRLKRNLRRQELEYRRVEKRMERFLSGRDGLGKLIPGWKRRNARRYRRLFQQWLAVDWELVVVQDEANGIPFTLTGPHRKSDQTLAFAERVSRWYQGGDVRGIPRDLGQDYQGKPDPEDPTLETWG